MGRRPFDGFDVSHDAVRPFVPRRPALGPAGVDVESIRLQTKLSANEWPQGAPVSASTKPG